MFIMLYVFTVARTLEDINFIINLRYKQKQLKIYRYYILYNYCDYNCNLNKMFYDCVASVVNILNLELCEPIKLV